MARLTAEGFVLGWFDGGYGGEGLNHSSIALMCLERYRQTSDGRFLSRVRAIADQYLTLTPVLGTLVFPGALGDAILLLVELHRETAEVQYFNRAAYFADLALELFWDGTSPLPKVTNQHPWYEVLTRADTLAMALLDLWATSERPQLDLGLQMSDR